MHPPFLPSSEPLRRATGRCYLGKRFRSARQWREEIVRATTADMLTDMGFEVIEACSGAEALRHSRERPRIDVVITDHLMPQMTGVELARAVAGEHPELPILIGYSDAIGIDAQLPRLEKPFRQADLTTSLVSLLSTDSTRRRADSDFVRDCRGDGDRSASAA